METVDIAGLTVCNLTMDEAIEQVIEYAIGDSKGHVVVTPNAEIAKDALDNIDFRKKLCKADMIVPDGTGVVLASKILGRPLKQKVAGIELLTGIMPKAEKCGVRLFFYGSKPGVAQQAADKLKKKYPSLNVCGILDGYTYQNADDIIQLINAAKPDITAVCLGAPKQENFIFDNLGKFDSKVLMGLGGSLDVISGNSKRAPEFYVKHNLEWFYRLIKEPKRFIRMMKLPAYIWDVLMIKVGIKKI